MFLMMTKFFTANVKRLLRGLSILVLGMLLALGWQSIARAQSLVSLESRLSRLESNQITLNARVSQIESAIGRIGRSTGIDLPPPRPQSQPRSQIVTGGVPSAITSDPAFERLANLVIDLGERVAAVEQRVNALQPRSSGR